MHLIDISFSALTLVGSMAGRSHGWQKIIFQGSFAEQAEEDNQWN